MTENNGSNGSGKVSIEFDEADLPLLFATLRGGACTEMMRFGKNKAAEERLRAYAESVRARLPAFIGDVYDQSFWSAIHHEMTRNPTWSVHAEAREWSWSQQRPVITVGEVQWQRPEVSREEIDQAIADIRGYLQQIAPMTCEEAIAPAPDAPKGRRR